MKTLIKWIAKNPKYTALIISIINTVLLFIVMSQKPEILDLGTESFLLNLWGGVSMFILFFLILFLGFCGGGMIVMLLDEGWTMFKHWAEKL